MSSGRGMIAGPTVTDARGKKHFDFSEPWPVTLLAVKGQQGDSYDDLKGKTVGVKNGTAFLEKNKNKYGYKIKTFSDEASYVRQFEFCGSVAAIMDDEPSSNTLLTRT